MATIIGKDPAVFRRCTCKNCASIVEFLPGEIQHRTVFDYGGGKDMVYFITCPGCAQEISVTKYGPPKYRY